YLYFIDASDRIMKWKASTGQYQGWVGLVGTVPTSGAAGCTTTAVGSYTPGWCKGGAGEAGTGDGAMQNPFGLVLSGSNFYVSDAVNNRISAYTASTGAFVGW